MHCASCCVFLSAGVLNGKIGYNGTLSETSICDTGIGGAGLGVTYVAHQGFDYAGKYVMASGCSLLHCDTVWVTLCG